MRELYPDAAREWRTAISFQPNNRNFQSKLAHSLWSAGEWRAAAETARALLDGRSESPELRFLLGDSLLKMQLPAEAAPHLTSAIAQRPNHLPARASLATAYIRLGEPSKAIPHLEAALPTDRDGSLRYQLAQAYRSVGQAEKAARLLTEYRQIREAFDRKNAQSKAESEITPPAE
jgi:predicted Zn-dependent protease